MGAISAERAEGPRKPRSCRAGPCGPAPLPPRARPRQRAGLRLLRTNGRAPANKRQSSCEQTAELLRTDGRADPRRVMLARGRQVQQLPGQGLRQLPALRRRREPRVRAQEGPRPHPTFPYTSDAHLFPTPSPPSPPLHKRMCVRGRQSQENRVCILLLHQEKEDAQESRRTQGS
jgi:hypothetical protein